MQASFRSNEGRIAPRLPYSNIRFMNKTLPARPGDRPLPPGAGRVPRRGRKTPTPAEFLHMHLSCCPVGKLHVGCPPIPT
jgi:hypothetical protein